MTIGIKWFVLCGALALGEAIAFLLPLMYPVWPLVLVLGILLTLFAFSLSWRYWILIGVFSFGAVLAWVTVDLRTQVIIETAELNKGKAVEATFTIPSSVKSYNEDKKYRKFVFPGEVRGIKVMVNLYIEQGQQEPKAGERWLCEGWMGRNSRGGIMGYRRFWVRGKGSSAKCIASKGEVSGLNSLIARVRNDFSRRSGTGLANKGEVEVLNKALVLGERSNIDRQTRDAFAASGTAHLFAVSGLHVFVIAKFFSIILALTGFPSRFKAFILIPLVWFYVLLVGAGPSAVRAGMMASLYWSAAVFWRKSDPLVAWAQTFAIVHILKPETLISTGSQLSFAVMLGLVLWNRIASGLKNRFATVFAPTVIAWVFGTPIIAATFSVITPGGLVVNLLAVPIAVFSVILSVLGILFSYISSYLAGVFNSAAHMSTSIVLGLARTAGAIGWSSFEIEKWSLLECVVWYVVVALVLWIIHIYQSRPRVKF